MPVVIDCENEPPLKLRQFDRLPDLCPLGDNAKPFDESDNALATGHWIDGLARSSSSSSVGIGQTHAGHLAVLRRAATHPAEGGQTNAKQLLKGLVCPHH